MNFFRTTLLSAGVQRTEDRKVNMYSGEKKIDWNLFSSERFDWFCMIHRWGNIRKMIKKHILEKKFSGVFFHKKFILTLLRLGVQNSGEGKKNYFLKRAFFSKKTILFKRLSENFVIKDQWEQKKDESNWKEKLIFRKKFLESFSDEKVFWWTLLSVRVQRTDHEKKKNYTLEKVFFSLNFVFLKKFWIVGIIH